jgi:hypothetical protein
MKNKNLLLLSVFLLSLLNVNAQHNDTFDCAFDSLMQADMEANPKLKSMQKAHLYNAQRFRQNNPNLKFYPKPQPESCDICLFGLEADSGCFKSRYALPVIVHIIHLPTDSVIGSGSNIPSSQVHDAIATLNRSFSGFGITDARAVNTEKPTSRKFNLHF